MRSVHKAAVAAVLSGASVLPGGVALAQPGTGTEPVYPLDTRTGPVYTGSTGVGACDPNNWEPDRPPCDGAHVIDVFEAPAGTTPPVVSGPSPTPSSIGGVGGVGGVVVGSGVGPGPQRFVGSSPNIIGAAVTVTASELATQSAYGSLASHQQTYGVTCTPTLVTGPTTVWAEGFTTASSTVVTIDAVCA